MTQQTLREETTTLEVENIGGIDEATLSLSPGVTVLTGRNATYRTSLLQALMAVMGSDAASIKADADEGHVKLTIGESTYTRRLYRQNGTVASEGEPYLDDPMLPNLFAFLTETNAGRRAVRRNENLREVVMRPVDTQDIESQISKLRSQRDEIDRQISNIEELSKKIHEVEEEKSRIESEIGQKKELLTEKEKEIAQIDEEVGEKKEEKEQFEAKLGKLNEVRGQIETIRRDINSQEESLEALKNERSNLRTNLEEYESLPEGRRDELETKIDRLRARKEKLTESINEIQTVIQFNEDLLDGGPDIFSDLRDDTEERDPTNRLLEQDEDLICWTCGSDIDTGQINGMLDDLRELRDEYVDERSDLADRIDELDEKRRELADKQRQHEETQSRLQKVENEIDERKSRIADLTERRFYLTDEIEALEREVEQLQTEGIKDSELLTLHKEANRLEVEIDRLESELADTTDEIERLEDRIADREDLETEREEIQETIRELRTRVKRIEKEAVAEFNDHMSSVLDILDYDNLERIWIERSEEVTSQNRGSTTDGEFDLHVVRSTDSGSVYEDTIDHLSESEREVTGLVFALAGYLVHDVFELVPFMLLDSVESIDAPRIAALVEYFKEYADYLVVALLEEDAQELDDSYERIREI